MRQNKVIICCLILDVLVGLASMPLMAATNDETELFLNYIKDNNEQKSSVASVKIRKNFPTFIKTIKYLKLGQRLKSSTYSEELAPFLKHFGCQASLSNLLALLTENDLKEYAIKVTYIQNNNDFYYTIPQRIGACGLYTTYHLQISRTGFPKSGHESILFFGTDGQKLKLLLSKTVLHFD